MSEDLSKELERLRKVNGQLRAAFNNVSEEREFLRKQIKEVREQARILIETCQMYEGQNNVSRPEDARFVPEGLEAV